MKMLLPIPMRCTFESKYVENKKVTSNTREVGAISNDFCGTAVSRHEHLTRTRLLEASSPKLESFTHLLPAYVQLSMLLLVRLTGRAELILELRVLLALHACWDKSGYFAICM